MSTLSRKVSIYRAPSWSWTSVDGPVNFGDCVNHSDGGSENYGLNSECAIVEHGVTLDGNLIDTCGKVSCGYVKITGRLREATCQPGHGPAYYYNYPVAALIVAPGTGSSNTRDCTGLFDVRELPQGRLVWCLQITTAFGLILVPKIGEQETFQRVGKYFLRCIGPERYCNWFRGVEKETGTIV